ncbi:MAG TPA: MTH1187 family thiamine-binding protein [Verrucomicrobiae bacterium]|nr:MTH1187 family thiamine-binding protein [Verrucomicrobiae bacterium]
MECFYVAIVAVTITPIGKGPSISSYVAAAEKVLDNKPGLKRHIGPMSTTLEGDLDEILQAIREMQEAVFAAGAERVATEIKIDDRRDKTISIEGKIQAVQAKLAQLKD